MSNDDTLSVLDVRKAEELIELPKGHDLPLSPTIAPGQDGNRFIVRGQISHIAHISKGETPITTISLRLRDYDCRPNGDTFTIHPVKIIYRDSIALKVFNTYKKGSFVETSGYIQSVFDRKNKLWTTECWGAEIRSAPKLFELISGKIFTGRYGLPDKNFAFIKGTVVGAKALNTGLLSLNIVTNVQKAVSFRLNSENPVYLRSSLTVNVSVSKAEDVAEKLSKSNKYVVLFGKLETVTKQAPISTTDGKHTRIQNKTLFNTLIHVQEHHFLSKTEYEQLTFEL